MKFERILLILIAVLLFRNTIELIKIKHETRAIRESFSVVIEDCEIDIKRDRWT